MALGAEGNLRGRAEMATELHDPSCRGHAAARVSAPVARPAENAATDTRHPAQLREDPLRTVHSDAPDSQRTVSRSRLLCWKGKRVQIREENVQLRRKWVHARSSGRKSLGGQWQIGSFNFRESSALKCERPPPMPRPGRFAKPQDRRLAWTHATGPTMHQRNGAAGALMPSLPSSSRRLRLHQDQGGRMSP